jgi:hypothetical protein
MMIRGLDLDPILQMAELDLQLAQFLLVNFALHLRVGIAARLRFNAMMSSIP